LDEGALADSGAVAGGLFPFAEAIEELGPEGEDPALHRLDGVDGAAAVTKEVALGVAGDAQAEAAGGPIDEFALEFGGRQSQELCDARQIGFGQVDETLLRATFRTAGLAFEAEALRHKFIMGGFAQLL
jgi:hypothetical protein